MEKEDSLDDVGQERVKYFNLKLLRLFTFIHFLQCAIYFIPGMELWYYMIKELKIPLRDLRKRIESYHILFNKGRIGDLNPIK